MSIDSRAHRIRRPMLYPLSYGRSITSTDEATSFRSLATSWLSTMSQYGSVARCASAVFRYRRWLRCSRLLPAGRSRRRPSWFLPALPVLRLMACPSGLSRLPAGVGALRGGETGGASLAACTAELYSSGIISHANGAIFRTAIVRVSYR